MNLVVDITARKTGVKNFNLGSVTMNRINISFRLAAANRIITTAASSRAVGITGTILITIVQVRNTSRNAVRVVALILTLLGDGNAFVLTFDFQCYITKRITCALD